MKQAAKIKINVVRVSNSPQYNLPARKKRTKITEGWKLWSHVSLAYDCVWLVNTIFPAVWWSTIALSFCRCDWLFPLSAREVSPGNRSNYKSTRERVDSKGLYGRWRLHLMGSWFYIKPYATVIIFYEFGVPWQKRCNSIDRRKERRWICSVKVQLK